MLMMVILRQSGHVGSREKTSLPLIRLDYRQT